MKTLRAWLLVSAACCLTSCMDADNAFIIQDPGDEIASAELRLCGQERALTRSEDALNVTFPISCEGSGHILVRLSDGEETSCPVGYVTPGLEQTFEFTVEDGQCR
jgi:hypothetical protein